MNCSSTCVKVGELTDSLSEHVSLVEDEDRQMERAKLSGVRMYQAGCILREMWRRVESEQKGNRAAGAKSSSAEEYEELRRQFVEVTASVSDEHLGNVVLCDITSAFVSVSQSFRSQGCGGSSGGGGGDDDGSKDVSAALDALSGIFVHSADGAQRLCTLAFDVRLCAEMALLYHHCRALQPADEHIDTAAMPGCILPILSSLLVHGLILPYNRLASPNDDDDSIRRVMEVLQALSCASPPKPPHTDEPPTHASHSSLIGCCLGDLRQCQSLPRPCPTLHEAIDSLFLHRADAAQKDYLLHIIQSCPTSARSRPSAHTHAAGSAEPQPPAPDSSAARRDAPSALAKLIQTVQSVLPDLGEGYIEVALACYDHSAQNTIAALIDAQSDASSLHPRLRVLDKALPARKKDSNSTYQTPGHTNTRTNNSLHVADKAHQEEIEAYQIQKRHLRQINDRQEAEALNLTIAMRTGGGDEYDDDYDDQYDGIGNDVADVGGGAFDVDLNAIKTYNKVTREMEADRLFWEESRNNNRRVQKNKAKPDTQDHSNDASHNDHQDADAAPNEKTYRGPNKGKKGRLIGPDGKYLPISRGSKNKGPSGNAQNYNNTNTHTNHNNKNDGNKDATGGGGLTKIQKRRKNDNKAKLGNHHRKERAMKKAAM